VEPKTAAQQAAYSKYLDERTDRESARLARVQHGGSVIPGPLLVIMLVTGVLVLVFAFFFADSSRTTRITRATGACSRRRWSAC
jgi:hypothetical protein